MQIEDFQKLEFSTLKWIKPISYRLPFARSYRWPLMGPYSDPFKLPNNSIWDIIWRCFFDLLPNCAAIRAEKPLQFGRDYCTVCSHRQPASVFSLLYWRIVAMTPWKIVRLKLTLGLNRLFCGFQITHKLYVSSRTMRGIYFYGSPNDIRGGGLILNVRADSTNMGLRRARRGAHIGYVT